MTYDNPLDVNRGPLDLRQGDRHKYVLEFFPLDLLAFTAIMAAGLASRWPPPTIEASLHRGNSDCKLATAQNMTYLHRHGGRFLSVLPRTRGEGAVASSIGPVLTVVDCIFTLSDIVGI